ncbi:MAG: DUF429 domain-containing protein [Burkholderiales bacterium]|nr:DUF429 domain-containing protein [Burkholderiales bacterium]
MFTQDEAKFVGVDVGGSRKGFHAVLLSGNQVLSRMHATDASGVRSWCLRADVLAIGIDAPCRWSAAGGGRLAERELAKAGMSTFSTPTRERGESHAFYQWMMNGARLYKELEVDYPLFDGQRNNDRFCVETFPHAVACALAGRIVSAKQKRVIRESLLHGLGLRNKLLSNIDYIDAALCAIAAESVAQGSYRKYGSAAEGYIVTPDQS